MALPGEAPPHLEINPYCEDPAEPAVVLAKEFAVNVHPVSEGQKSAQDIACTIQSYILEL